MSGTIFIRSPECPNLSLEIHDHSTVSFIVDNFGPFDCGDFYVVHQGKRIENNAFLQNGHTYHVVPRLAGGKGGFGSMLRALGAQIEKTTNREACRDLSGRRMRDVNNEQKLRDWVSKAADREREKEQKRRERLERRKAEPKHNFNDEDYAKQKSQVFEGLEDALHKGLQKITSGSSTCTVTSSSRKRKSEDPGPSSSAKKSYEWLGDGLSLSDLDSDSDDEHRPEALPEPPAGASSYTEQDRHSDSGVESVTEMTVKGSPMDVDSDTSGKDSAVNSDVDFPSQPTVEMVKFTPEEAFIQAESFIEAKPAEPVIDPSSVDLMNFSSVADIEALGLDTLKNILMAKGMKCGGTLQQRAERLWAVRGIPNSNIDASLLAKTSKGKRK